MFRGILKELVLNNSYYWLTQEDWEALYEIFEDDETYGPLLNSFETITEDDVTIRYINANSIDMETWGEWADEGFALEMFNYIKSTDTFFGG